MTQTGYANAIVNAMLGWLKGLASWVLKLFNLAGSGGSPLEWLSNNWLKLLILLMLVGVVMDRLIWLLRWRPYWAWFKRKRIIVNDEKMLAGEALQDLDPEDDEGLIRQSYVVRSQTPRRAPAKRPSTVRPERAAQSANRKPAAKPEPRAAARTPARENKPSMPAQTTARPTDPTRIPPRTVARPSAQTQIPPRVKPRAEQEGMQRGARRPQRVQPQKKRSFVLIQRKPISAGQIDDELFEIGRTQSDYSDFDEDQVFNVSNLPGASSRAKKDRKRRW